MILNLLYTLVRFVLDLLLVRGRPENSARFTPQPGKLSFKP
jgi:hypothetical protein